MKYSADLEDQHARLMAALHEDAPPSSRRSLPPDNEGDEPLLERRGRLMFGWDRDDPLGGKP